MAILDGGIIFACRRCYRLVYPSQRQSFSDRAAARADAIKDRLGGIGCFFDPVPPRPKGMHRQTYHRLALGLVKARYQGVSQFAARMGMSLDDLSSLG